MARVAELLCSSLPGHSYSGKSPSALLPRSIPNFFLKRALLLRQSSTSWEQSSLNSVVVGHPNTAAHLHCPPLLAALAAEVVISALNQSMDSFDQAPMATILEKNFVQWLTAEAGFSRRRGRHLYRGRNIIQLHGITSGSRCIPEVTVSVAGAETGVAAGSGAHAVLCSEAAHFTVEKSAAQLGLGTDAVIRVSVDDEFRMRPESCAPRWRI